MKPAKVRATVGRAAQSSPGRLLALVFAALAARQAFQFLLIDLNLAGFLHLLTADSSTNRPNSSCCLLCRSESRIWSFLAA